MEIQIYSGADPLYTFPRVLSASMTDKLDGERTLEFSVLSSRALQLVPGLTVKLENEIYTAVRVARKITGGFPVATVSCEHISYILNDEKYNLVTFVFEGTPQEGLRRLLDGTPFSVGAVEATSRVEVAFTEGTLNRRNALMRFIDACGCEVEFNGYTVNLRTHRGSRERKRLMGGVNVRDLSVVLESREGTASYDISLFKMADLRAGDEVNITYRPMGVNVDTRIVGITYNPFNRYTVRVEVGDYVPNLMASTATQVDKIRQEFRAADGELRSTIEQVDGSMSELSQTVSGFDTRIKDAEGNVSALSQTVSGFDTRIETAEGAVSEMRQTVEGFDTRIETAEGDIASLKLSATEFNTRITAAEGDMSTIKQTVEGIETSIQDMKGNISSFSQTLTGFETKITDVEEGMSSVTQTVSGIQTSIEDMEGSLSSFSQTLTGFETKITNVEEGMSSVTQTVGSIQTSIEDLEGNLSSFEQTLTSFETRITTAEGGLSTLQQTVEGFSTRIEDSEKNVSSLSQTVSSISTRVSTAEGNVSTLKQNVSSISTEITTIKGNVSTITQNVTSITSRVADAEKNITTVTQTADKITWLVKSGTSSTNFELTDRAISLVSKTIDLSGFVTFTALSTSGKTTINGANITTGTISADRIDADSLKVKTIYSASSNKISIKEYSSSTMYIGGDGSWNYSYVNIYAASQVKIGKWDDISVNSIIIDTNARSLRPGSSLWTLGNSSNYWSTGYISKLYLNQSCYLSASGSALQVNGSALKVSTDFSGSQVKMGGSSSYYINVTTSRQLCPSGTSTSYPFYLGTSSYFWQYAYIGSTQAYIGSSTSSKVGFFGSAGSAKLALSTSSNNQGFTSANANNYLYCINNVIGILKKYGLIA